MLEMGYRLPANLTEWITFPQYQIPMQGTLALMWEHPFDFILLLSLDHNR